MTNQIPVKRGRGRPRKVITQDVSERSNYREEVFRPKAITQGNDPRFHAFRHGWNEALAGKPIDYELLDQLGNVNKWLAIVYETGRMKALSVLSHNIKPPAWTSTDRIPPKVTAAINQAYTRSYWEAKNRGEPVICDWPLGDEGKWLPPNPEWNEEETSMPSVY